MDITTIGTNYYGEKYYRVYLATGTAWYKVFQVYAYNESEAVDMVADYVEENELEGLYADYWELFDLCDVGQTVDEYAEAHNLICCGNHGIYLEVAGLEEITNDGPKNT
jgi:hypothetical protein